MAIKIGRLPREEFRARDYRTVRTGLFLLKIKKNDIGKARIGVVVGVKVHKSAAKRNFFKRQVRARLARAIKNGTDALVIVSPAAVNATRKQFQEEMAGAVAKGKMGA